PVAIRPTSETPMSATPLPHYQHQHQLIEPQSRLFIGPAMRVASWVVHRVVCLFVCFCWADVFISYIIQRFKKQERNARTFTRGRPRDPEARYSEISIFRKIVLLAKFRNILSGTKHTQHLVWAAERRRSPGYHAYNFSWAIFVKVSNSGFEYTHAKEITGTLSQDITQILSSTDKACMRGQSYKYFCIIAMQMRVCLIIFCIYVNACAIRS